jgi:hypothetical protein
MEINWYGESCNGTPMKYRLARNPLESKVIGSFTYNRFSDGTNVIIHRLGVGENGLVLSRCPASFLRRCTCISRPLASFSHTRALITRSSALFLRPLASFVRLCAYILRRVALL